MFGHHVSSSSFGLLDLALWKVAEDMIAPAGYFQTWACWSSVGALCGISGISAALGPEIKP
jgi:hypothetical protein